MTPQPIQPAKVVVRIIHYNDVYNIAESPREPIGGAARFVTAVRRARDDTSLPTLVIFSGDAFSPAPLTPLTAGAEIPPVLNATHIDVACIGNHEFDLGLDVLRQRLSETHFPWLLSNLTLDGSPLHGVQQTAVVERGGVRFGFFGLASWQWLQTLVQVPVERFEYTDYVEAADEMATQLRERERCEVVVALTHMRQPEDERLAREARDVDVILGGHDHVLARKKVNGRYVVKSGTDFKNFSTIDVGLDAERRVVVERPVQHAVTGDVPEDVEVAAFAKVRLSELGTEGEDVIARSATELDGRFVSIRTRETALGNFICDLMTECLEGRIGLINAGSFRSDTIELAGPLTKSSLAAILPFDNQAALIDLSGRELLAILENSVSQYPLLDGRFLQVSGVSFTFDAAEPSGRRVLRESVRCKLDTREWAALEEEERYVVAMKTFIIAGKDGFAKGDPKQILKTCNEAIRDLLVEELLRRGGGDLDVAPEVEGRIVCLHPDEELVESYGETE